MMTDLSDFHRGESNKPGSKAGGILAYCAYSKDAHALQATAGFLLITGFACLGVAVYLIGGLPF